MMHSLRHIELYQENDDNSDGKDASKSPVVVVAEELVLLHAMERLDETAPAESARHQKAGVRARR